MDESQDVTRTDVRSALFCMALISRFSGHRVASDTLLHQFGHLKKMTPLALVSALRESGMKAQTHRFRRRSLTKLPLPAILAMRDGSYVVLQSVVSNTGRVHRFDQSNPDSVDLDDLVKASTGWVILARPSRAGDRDVEQVDRPQKFGIGWFFKTLFKYGSVMREAMLASVFVQLFALASPIVFMIVIDKVFAHNNLSTLDVLVVALAAITLFDVLLNGIRTYLISHTSHRVDVELGMRLFRHLMSLPLSYFESRSSGDTIARMREMETIRSFLTGSTLTLLVDIIFVGVFLSVMFLFSSTLSWIVVGSLPLFFAVSSFLTPLMKRRLEDRHEKAAENQSFLVETLTGIETIKSGAVEPRQRRAYEERIADYAGCAFQSTRLSNWINQLVGLLSKVLTITLLYVGAHLVLSGKLTVGQLIAFNMLSGRVIAPVQRLAQIWQELTGVRVALRRLSDIMEAPAEAGVSRERTRLPKLEGRIRFDHVSFRYRDDRPEVLTDISFQIEPGELVGIIGTTGSGKTTLIKLVQRLYSPTSGGVFIDNHNLCALDPAWLRRQIGVVSQDYVLFNRTIRENITLGDHDIDDQRLVEAAHLTGAHDIIVGLPNGYDTRLEERGRGLSAGQRQAIALTRAIVTQPPILILDEATSAFDYETEQRFQDNFADIRRGRTTLVVAHRLSTLRDADRILTLEAGRLTEDETASSLLQQGGRFAAMQHYDAVSRKTQPRIRTVAVHGA
ncbi:MAG: peptidase C39 [marine bacterium B5-7]|nr:MAG: peptidase C39 [marine bacterium B5-7]